MSVGGRGPGGDLGGRRGHGRGPEGRDGPVPADELHQTQQRQEIQRDGRSSSVHSWRFGIIEGPGRIYEWGCFSGKYRNCQRFRSTGLAFHVTPTFSLIPILRALPSCWWRTFRPSWVPLGNTVSRTLNYSRQQTSTRGGTSLRWDLAAVCLLCRGDTFWRGPTQYICYIDNSDEIK